MLVTDNSFLKQKFSILVQELDEVRIKLMIDSAVADAKKNILEKEIRDIEKQLNENNK